MAVSTPARMENGQGCGPEFALLVGQRHLEACPGSTAPTGAYLWADVRNRNHPCLLSSRRWLVARLTAGQHFMSKVCRTDVWGETGGGGGCYWFTCGRTGCCGASAHENEAGAVLMNQLATWRVYRPPRGFVGGPRQLEGRLNVGKAHGIEVRRVGWDDKQPVFASDSARVAGGGSPLHGWAGLAG